MNNQHKKAVDRECDNIIKEINDKDKYFSNYIIMTEVDHSMMSLSNYIYNLMISIKKEVHQYQNDDIYDHIAGYIIRYPNVLYIVDIDYMMSTDSIKIPNKQSIELFRIKVTENDDYDIFINEKIYEFYSMMILKFYFEYIERSMKNIFNILKDYQYKLKYITKLKNYGSEETLWIADHIEKNIL